MNWIATLVIINTSLLFDVAVGYPVLKTGILWRSGSLESTDLGVCFQSTPANKPGGGAKRISFVLSWTKDRL